jgi:hypothetical protein
MQAYGKDGENHSVAPNPARHSVYTHITTQDCLFLCAVTLLSSLHYVCDLGFYSDDWSHLAMFSQSGDQSIFGLFRYAYYSYRPVHVGYMAGMYWLFGLHPLGYHLVNLGVFTAAVCLFYLTLRGLGITRLLALTVPLVYAFLPHYSTDRFWFAAHQANLSMGLYFLSLYSDLRALRSRSARWWVWKLLSIVSLLGSIFAYEVALPLFLLNLSIIWRQARKAHDPNLGHRITRARLAVSLMSNLLALILVAGFKALTTNRTVIHSGFVRHIVGVAKGALVVNYGQHGIGLPMKVWSIIRDYPDWSISALGGVLGLMILWYLYCVAEQPGYELPGKTSWIKLVALGLVVFGLGYAIFFTTPEVVHTSTGIGNRINIAAAVGIAMSLVGGIGLLATYLPPGPLRRRFFCLLVMLLCVSGFLVTNTLASFWITAYRQEQEILVDIRKQFPTLPANSALVLDGVCPYAGPAIIFESNWDLAGALQIIYNDPTLSADVVTPNLQIEDEGLSTELYGHLYRRYPYGEKLLLYHYGRKVKFHITDTEAARQYFRTYNPDRSGGCPKGSAGHGVRVFKELEFSRLLKNFW